MRPILNWVCSPDWYTEPACRNPQPFFYYSTAIFPIRQFFYINYLKLNAILRLLWCLFN